jgi:hypothetical protein
MTEHRSIARRINRETAAAMLAGLLVLACVYAYFCIRLYRGYLLLRDDPANIGGTAAQGLRGWFTHGMAGYYHVYPEWPQPGFSNFYRPVWNLILYAEQAAFGPHYWAWFLFFCAVQYLGALLFLRVARALGMAARPAWFFTLLFLFNPAFLNFGLIYPGFQFDVFASLMLLAALYLLLRHRHAAAWGLITIAVFTKETAIFAPVVAAATVFILSRDLKWSAAMLIPLAAWIAARLLAFHAVMGGTFESPASVHDLLINIGKGLIVWPSSAVPASFPLSFAGGYGVALAAFLVMNVALWLILACAAWQVAHALLLTPQKTNAKLQAVLLLWALGALSFCLLTRPQTRLGASVYVFLLLFLAIFLSTNAWPKIWKLVAVAILAFVTLIRAGNFLDHALANLAPERNGERALHAALHALPQDGRAVFIVNGPTMLSAPGFLAQAWHIKREIIFLDQIRGCPHAASGDERYALSSTSLAVTIPPCASYVLAGVPENIQTKALSGVLARPGIGAYQFSSLPGKRLPDGDIDFGRALRIRFAAPVTATVLAYDWQSGTYRPLAPAL